MNQETILERSKLISLASNGFLTAKEVGLRLNLSIRQVRRLISRFRDGLLGGSLIKLRKPAWNKTDQKTIEEILKLKQEGPWRSNQYLSELIEERLGKQISPVTIRKILLANNLYQKEKITRRFFNRLEERITSFGQMVQLDTLEGCWLRGYRRTYLICLMDAFSRYILGFQWVDSNSAWANISLLRQMIEKYGIPAMLYTDNASYFKIIRHNQSIHQKHKSENQYQTTIQRIMLDLNSVLVCHKPFEPQGKGRLERFFWFVQTRFIPEKKATNLKELNQEFKKWINWYNHHHIIRTIGCKPKDRLKPSSFKPVNQDFDLNRIFSFHYTRKIDKYNSFSFEGENYIIDPKNCKEWNGCLTAFEVDLSVTPETITVYFHNQLIQKFKRKTKN